jgi:hypothetical protein
MRFEVGETPESGSKTRKYAQDASLGNNKEKI